MKKLAVTVFFATFSLILIGLVIVMSASSTYSATKFDSSFHLFNSHLFRVVLGLILMAAFSFIPYESYKKISKPAILGASLLLIITLLIAPQVKGSGRWLSFGFITIQPADIARLILIVHLALLYLGIKNTHIGPTLPGFMTPDVLKVVQDKFGVQTITTVEEDMKIFEFNYNLS